MDFGRNHSLIDGSGIARISASWPSGERSSFGTGTLVSPTQILTCAHVVSKFNPLSPAVEDLEDTCGACQVHFAPTPEFPGETIEGRVTNVCSDDLAVITLAKSVDRPPLQFDPFVVPWMFDLEYSQRFVVGFDRANTSHWSITEFRDAVLFHSRGDIGLLQEFQTDGGISPGMSGSPLILVRRRTALCAGVVFLGGTAAGRSRFIAAGSILSFLGSSGIDAEFRGPFATPSLRNNEWLRLLGTPDFLLRAREFESRDSMCDIIGTSRMRSIANSDAVDAGHVRIDEGARVRIVVRLPRPAELILIDVELIAGRERLYSLVGCGLVPERRLSAGYHAIPGNSHGFRMEGPVSTNCLVAIAVDAEAESSIRELAREPRSRRLSPEELNTILKQIEALPPTQRWVSFCAYEVCRR